jgi:carbapenam-3-carboxylate synthase
VQACAAGGGRVAVPLSGGLDSSLITAFAARGTPNLATISVGTELSDEFSFAETVARHAGTRHTSLVLTHEAILRGLVDAIYHNEIYDGLSSEIQAPLFALYRRVSGEHDTLLTGYGADLLFGGILPFQTPSRAANDALWEQVYRTRWTGEFSPTGARSFGLTVKHPFWSNRLVAFCLDLDPALKVSTDEIKILLRKLAGQDGLLPREIAARKKIGIHEGSSVNRIFADAIGTTTAQYAAKTRFSYFVYRTLLQRRMKAREVEPAQMLDLYRHDAGAGR